MPLMSPDELLVTVEALRGWTGDTIDDDDPLALNVLGAITIRLHQYGDKDWTRATLPREARLIGEIKAKNFWEHPTGARQESVDVLSESFINEVLTQITFTEAEQAELARLGDNDGTDKKPLGVWALTVTRGPLETHPGGRPGATYYRDSWDRPFPLLPENYFLGPR